MLQLLNLQRKYESKELFHGMSPFLVEKAISGSIGEVKSTNFDLATYWSKLDPPIKPNKLETSNHCQPFPFNVNALGILNLFAAGNSHAPFVQKSAMTSLLALLKRGVLIARANTLRSPETCLSGNRKRKLSQRKSKTKYLIRKLLKSKTSATGNSFSSLFKKISATVSTQWDLADISSAANLKPSDSTRILCRPHIGILYSSRALL
ncbi:hypothetical protein AVEN_7626-1 [Araneus ventricosus]|uniref:Uncharacterized protein n=1 Tax=Araneus ventricosus TaxID=182803 RepID=A0A4Y2N108_ARAVE|nr:hypothetical protein AVEN_7626-1 [Araneus ventricosus]